MPRLGFDGVQFFFDCDFQTRSIPKDAGFYWLPESRKWCTKSIAAAVKLREYADDAVKRILKNYLITVTPWLNPLPLLPPNLKLMPHQIDATRFALERNKCYLALDPGLGKTIVAAVVARAIKNFHPVCYVCPPFLMKNVAAEFRKWAPNTPLELIPDSQLNKSELIDRARAVASSGGTLFIDEAHRFKNPDAKRTQAVFGHKMKKGLVDIFRKVVLLSGTPIPNRPMELYPVLSKLAPETIEFMSSFAYGRKYCGGFEGPFGWDFSGASNLGELRRRVVAPDGPFMLRLKKDLLDLPPKTEEVFVVSADMSPRLAKLDRNLGDKYSDTEDLIKLVLAASAGRDADTLPMATYRRLLGSEKVKGTLPFIEAILEETNESLLIFAYHKDTVAKLKDGLETHSPLVITGDTKPGDRQAIVNEFQTLPERRVLIGNYTAMGVGFTLTKATRVLFVEFSWVDSENVQAADRAHRIGQKSSVLVQYVAYENSLDKLVLETLLRKRRITNHV